MRRQSCISTAYRNCHETGATTSGNVGMLGRYVAFNPRPPHVHAHGLLTAYDLALLPTTNAAAEHLSEDSFEGAGAKCSGGRSQSWCCLQRYWIKYQRVSKGTDQI